MFDKELIKEIILQNISAIERIERRFSGINNPNEFMSSDEGIDRLDSISMMLIAIGESCKHIDKITNGKLLSKYPEFDWKGVKGMRDILSHHYFDINAEIVYSVCKTHIPDLKRIMLKMTAKI